MNHFFATVQQTARVLGQLGTWLDAAAQHAKTRAFDPDTLVHARLAPDQFALGRQLQSACDSAKYLAAKLTGRTAPAHADVEITFAQLRERLASVVAYLGTFTEDDFANAAQARCTFRWLPGKYLEGAAYLHEYELPNFYFHASHAYAILRHNGVALGKRDFLGTGMPFKDL